MNNTLIYTFQRFPFDDQLRLPIEFRFQKFNIDIERLGNIIKKRKPSIIVGLAKSAFEFSSFESQAVNIYNKSKLIDKDGPNKYSLIYPKEGYKSIKINTYFTDSFCNWTMYKISQMIEEQDIKLQFIHIDKKDIPILNEYLRFLTNSRTN